MAMALLQVSAMLALVMARSVRAMPPVLVAHPVGVLIIGATVARHTQVGRRRTPGGKMNSEGFTSLLGVEFFY